LAIESHVPVLNIMNDEDGLITGRSDFFSLNRGFISQGGELSLSNKGQLELLRTITGRNAQYRTMVRGYSMAPFIRDRDVVVIAPLDGHLPKIGDVVAFVLPDCEKLAIHRVIKKAGNSCIICGDNSTDSDGNIPYKNILGRVIAVERRGHAVRFGLGIYAGLIAWLQRMKLLIPAVRLAGMLIICGRSWLSKAISCCRQASH
jgi:hypothetical protein